MFCDMYMPHLSGVTNHIRLTKKQLEALGHEVWVFTYGNRDHTDDEPNVLRSPAVAWGKTGWQAGLRPTDEARSVMRTLDIAHVHHPFASGRVALKYAGANGTPVVFTNHTRYDLYSDAYARFFPRRARLGFLQKYLSEFTSEMSAVIAPSPGIVDWLAEFGVTDSAVHLPNGVDTRPFANPIAPMSKAELGFDEDFTVLCYLGRLGPEKNISMLMDAFVGAATVNPRVGLLLIGDGPSRSLATERAWAHMLGDRVHFAGKTPYERVPDYLAASDVFVSASVSEVHPLVFLEAMAAGLPAIGVRSPGVSDIVVHNKTGLLTEEDTSEFSARILDLARDRDCLEELSANARQEAARFDIRPAVDRLVELYEGQQTD